MWGWFGKVQQQQNLGKQLVILEKKDDESLAIHNPWFIDDLIEVKDFLLLNCSQID